MSDNWVVQNLQNALGTWNDKLAEVWQLMTMSPENFKGGGIWSVVLNINGAMQAIGLALLVLFFLAGVVQTSANLTDVKRTEHALKLQLAVKKILEAIYGPRFLNCMYGFRPKRGCHEAVKEVYQRISYGKINYIRNMVIRNLMLCWF